MSKNYSIPSPIISFQPPIYTCQYNTKPFTLDGNLDKDFWADIPFTEPFIDIEGSSRPTPRFLTKAKLAWDDNNLYVGAILYGDEIWATVTQRDDVIFVDNDFEVFLDPDSDTQQYYEFEMNALNTIWDLMLTKAYRDGGKPLDSWDIKGIRSAVHIEHGTLNGKSEKDAFWSVEIVFPYRSLLECAPENRRPSEGDYWRLNFSRVQWNTDFKDGKFIKQTKEDGKTPLPEDNWVWAPTGVINIHYPELWGFLFFTKDASKTFSIPDMEYRKWELRKLYYLQSHYRNEHDHYAVNLSDLTTDLPSYPIYLETTSHTYELYCRNAEDTGTIYLYSDGKTGFIPDEDK